MKYVNISQPSQENNLIGMIKVGDFRLMNSLMV